MRIALGQGFFIKKFEKLLRRTVRRACAKEYQPLDMKSRAVLQLRGEGLKLGACVSGQFRRVVQRLTATIAGVSPHERVVHHVLHRNVVTPAMAAGHVAFGCDVAGERLAVPSVVMRLPLCEHHSIRPAGHHKHRDDAPCDGQKERGEHKGIDRPRRGQGIRQRKAEAQSEQDGSERWEKEQNQRSAPDGSEYLSSFRFRTGELVVGRGGNRGKRCVSQNSFSCWIVWVSTLNSERASATDSDQLEQRWLREGELRYFGPQLTQRIVILRGQVIAAVVMTELMEDKSRNRRPLAIEELVTKLAQVERHGS